MFMGTHRSPEEIEAYRAAIRLGGERIAAKTLEERTAFLLNTGAIDPHKLEEPHIIRGED